MRLTATFSLLLIASSAFAMPGEKMVRIASETRQIAGEINQAIAERTKTNPNLDEICFRVGNLYQVLRHELQEELDAGGKVVALEIAKHLVEDAKSLTSFCGDQEKLQLDPGYEQVSRGDVTALQQELSRIVERASRLN